MLAGLMNLEINHIDQAIEYINRTPRQEAWLSTLQQEKITLPLYEMLLKRKDKHENNGEILEYPPTKQN